MISLERHLDTLLARGRGCFSAEDARTALGQTRTAFAAAAQRLRKKRRLASPRRDFFVILRPEDRAAGSSDPARWIDPLMRHLGFDYRVSLLRAAALHGSSHQAAMLFQVIAPRQLRSIAIGRHRVQFVYQSPAAFVKVNRMDWLDRIKTDAGFARAAGIELTLLDSIRYFHRAAGIDGVAQIVHDLGRRAHPGKLARAAAAYESSAVRRLGFLLDRFGCRRQALALVRFAKKAKSMKPLDPSIRPLGRVSRRAHPVDSKWMLILNRAVEIDS